MSPVQKWGEKPGLNSDRSMYVCIQGIFSICKSDAMLFTPVLGRGSSTLDKLQMPGKDRKGGWMAG